MSLEWPAQSALVKTTAVAMPQNPGDGELPANGESAFGTALNREVQQEQSADGESRGKSTSGHGKADNGFPGGGDKEPRGFRSAPMQAQPGNKQPHAGMKQALPANRQGQTPVGPVRQAPGESDEAVQPRHGFQNKAPVDSRAAAPVAGYAPVQYQGPTDSLPEQGENLRMSPGAPDDKPVAQTGQPVTAPTSTVPVEEQSGPANYVLEPFDGLKKAPSVSPWSRNPLPEPRDWSEKSGIRLVTDPPLVMEAKSIEQPGQPDASVASPLDNGEMISDSREADIGIKSVPLPESSFQVEETVLARRQEIKVPAPVTSENPSVRLNPLLYQEATIGDKDQFQTGEPAKSQAAAQPKPQSAVLPKTQPEVLPKFQPKAQPKAQPDGQPESKPQAQPQFPGRAIQTLVEEDLPQSGKSPERGPMQHPGWKAEGHTLLKGSSRVQPERFVDNETEIARKAEDVLTGRQITRTFEPREIPRAYARNVSVEDTAYEPVRKSPPSRAVQTSAQPVTQESPETVLPRSAASKPASSPLNAREAAPAVDEVVKNEHANNETKPAREQGLRIGNPVNPGSREVVPGRSGTLPPERPDMPEKTENQGRRVREFVHAEIEGTKRGESRETRDNTIMGRSVREFVAEIHDKPERVLPAASRPSEPPATKQPDNETPKLETVQPDKTAVKAEKDKDVTRTEEPLVKVGKSSGETSAPGRQKEFLEQRPERTGTETGQRDSQGHQQGQRERPESRSEPASAPDARSGQPESLGQQVRELAAANTGKPGLGTVVREMAREHPDKENRIDRKERIEGLPNRVDKLSNAASNTGNAQRMVMSSRVSTVQEAYMKVMAAVERMTSAGDTSRMQMRLQFEDGEEMSVVFKYAKGHLHTVFMTDSDGLRTAMREGWEQIQRQLLERGVEADQPDFQQGRQDQGNRGLRDELWEDSLPVIPELRENKVEAASDPDPRNLPTSTIRTLNAYA